jgi:hypothetical protein
MTKVKHSDLAKHLPPDFLERHISEAEFMRLLAEIKGSTEPAVKLMVFLKKYGFEVEK